MLGGIASQSSDRTDYVAQSGLYTKGIVPLVGAEIARNAGPAQVTMGASFASTSPSGTIPPVSAIGPNYRRISGPDVAYATASAHAVAGWLTVVVPVLSTQMSLDVHAEQSRPSGARASVLQPSGARTMWSIGIGVRPSWQALSRNGWLHASHYVNRLSSADGPYNAGTVAPTRRKYTVICPR